MPRLVGKFINWNAAHGTDAFGGRKTRKKAWHIRPFDIPRAGGNGHGVDFCAVLYRFSYNFGKSSCMMKNRLALPKAEMTLFNRQES